jgi:hypothetical protein
MSSTIIITPTMVHDYVEVYQSNKIDPIDDLYFDQFSNPKPFSRVIYEDLNLCPTRGNRSFEDMRIYWNGLRDFYNSLKYELDRIDTSLPLSQSSPLSKLFFI